jgi:amino acid transporter
MTTYEKLRHLVLGKPLDPLSVSTRQHIALVAFLAWVGLGADGLSSSAYGPEEAFKALGPHTHLGLFMALATAATVFIISLAYNQVIELFPTGGGGYRVATSLLGPRAGLISGAALIVDYVLTIAISIASGVDALFSLLPANWSALKLGTELALVTALLMLNLRGMKESIRVLLPVFLGFVVVHATLIAYGVFGHSQGITFVVPNAIAETHALVGDIGWVAALSLFLRAYSLGGGTYTGIEAVSNNVQTLREPVVRTGKLTMFYMATSLAFTAGGIILLYLLWQAQPVEGQTLNAVVFGSILESMGLSEAASRVALTVVLATEAGLLFVAANTGFLGGPRVLSNMAADSWLPHQFRHLSTRLVTQNGIVIMGLAALMIVLWSRGSVDLLVVLYSINVFLTFTLSLIGLCVYWWRARARDWRWRHRLVFSAVGLVLTAGILAVTVVEKFEEGGWVTVLITSLVIGLCLAIHRHYDWVKARLKEVDEIFSAAPCPRAEHPPALDPSAPTAVFMVGSSRGGGLHTVLWVQRLFPDHFRNFVFISAKAVDAQSYGGTEEIGKLRSALDRSLSFYVNYCHANGLAATARFSLGTDRVDELVKLAEEVQREYANCVFFTSKLVFRNENWVTRLLHNQTALALQRRLHLSGMQMVILPMQL